MPLKNQLVSALNAHGIKYKTSETCHDLEKRLMKVPGFKWNSHGTYISHCLLNTTLSIPSEELLCIREMVRIGSYKLVYQGETVARFREYGGSFEFDKDGKMSSIHITTKNRALELFDERLKWCPCYGPSIPNEERSGKIIMFHTHMQRTQNEIIHGPSDTDLNYIVYNHNNFGTLRELVFSTEGIYVIGVIYSRHPCTDIPKSDLENYHKLYVELINTVKLHVFNEINKYINEFLIKVNEILAKYNLKIQFFPCVNNIYDGINFHIPW